MSFTAISTSHNLSAGFADHMRPLVTPFRQYAENIKAEAKRAEAAGLLSPKLVSETIPSLSYSLPSYPEQLDHLIRIGLIKIVGVIEELISNESIQDLETYNKSYEPLLAFLEKIASLPDGHDTFYVSRNNIIIFDKEANPPVVCFLNPSLNQSLDNAVTANNGKCLALMIKDKDGVSMFESFFRIVFETIKMHLFALPVNQEPAAMGV